MFLQALFFPTAAIFAFHSSHLIILISNSLLSVGKYSSNNDDQEYEWNCLYSCVYFHL